MKPYVESQTLATMSSILNARNGKLVKIKSYLTATLKGDEPHVKTGIQDR